MAKYLIASYTNEGVKGVITKGGTARRDAVERMASDLGGRLESFYFAFGDGDAFATVELPDNVGAAAVALAVGASGMATASHGASDAGGHRSSGGDHRELRAAGSQRSPPMGAETRSPGSAARVRHHTGAR